MTLAKPLLRKLLISTFLVAASAGTSYAQDINSVAARLKSVFDNQGIKVEWTGVSGDASEMMLEGVTASMTGTPGSVAIGQVTLSDITEENGGYKIGGLTLPDYSITEDGATVAISGFEIAGLRLGAEGSTDPIANLMLYDTADLADFSVTVGGKKAFGMTGVHAETTLPEGGNPMAFTVTSDGFEADLTLVEDPQSKAVLEALGYGQIKGAIEMEGSWQPTDGRMALSQYDVSVDDAGTFGMTFDLGGYTPDFIKALQDMQKQMAAQPAGADNSAAGLAMMGLMQQLTFHGASIRFDDDSLTGKALEFIATSQGQSVDQIKNMAKGMTPIMLAQVVTDQALIQSVSAAVTAFLDDPKSLEIKAAPPQAVPFALIMAGAMSAPQELPKTLSVSVTANQ